MNDAVESTGLDRRTIFKGAAGLGAATALAGVLTTSHTASAAVGIAGELENIGTFEVYSLQWGAGVGVSAPGAGGSRQASAPSISEATLTIPNGEWSVAILDALLSGSILPSGSVTITPKSRSGPAVKFEFEDVIVSGYSTSVSSEGDQMSESLSLNFVGLTYTVGGTSVSYPK